MKFSAIILYLFLVMSCDSEQLGTRDQSLKYDTISIGDSDEVDPGIIMEKDRTVVEDSVGRKIGPVH
jgi:hypothetical protein